MLDNLDDLEDMLQDSEPTGSRKKPVGGRSWGDIANKAGASKNDDLDDFSDEEKFSWPKKKPKGQQSVPALKQSIEKKDDDDEWGNVGPSTTKLGQHSANSARRSNRSNKEDDDFDAMLGGIVGHEEKQPEKPKPASSKNSFGGTKTGHFGAAVEDLDDSGWGNIPATKKSSFGKRSNQDDDLDNMLDDLEAKKGIEKERPKTANVPLWTAQRNDSDLDGLDDFQGDESSKIKIGSDTHQRSNDDIQARKKSLFGVDSKP